MSEVFVPVSKGDTVVVLGVFHNREVAVEEMVSDIMATLEYDLPADELDALGARAAAALAGEDPTNQISFPKISDVVWEIQTARLV